MYDLTVIGGGWAGFNAAIKAKEMGLKVALIEKGEVGGTCLNLGCIPTKSLLYSAKVFSIVRKSSDFGVSSPDSVFNFSRVMERKNQVVESLRSGMVFMLKGVDIIKGEAVIISPELVEVNGKPIKSRFIIIATGSKPLELSTLKFDNKKIISSNEALNLKELPASILIIGGGAIGCEFANLFSELGSQVTIAEKENRLLPAEDNEISSKLEYSFKKKNITVKVGFDEPGLSLKNYDFILVCIGREAVSRVQGLKEAGIKLEGGRIITDDFLKTDVDNIYAAGDCTSEVMLAHLAGYQGRVAVENIFKTGKKQKRNPPVIPNSIFTDPEVSSAGLTEKEAKEEGMKVRISKFDFMASGMARILGEASGFLKIISDEASGKLLGFSMIGPRASEVSGVLTLAISSGLKARDLCSTIFPHPTISEAIGESLNRNNLS